MSETYKINGKNLIINLCGELDHHIAEEIRENIDSIIDKNMIKNVIFDFKNVNFMDSSGIGVIIGRYKKVSDFEGKVLAVGINDRVKKIFELSGLQKIISIYNDCEEAIRTLS